MQKPLNATSTSTRSPKKHHAQTHVVIETPYILPADFRTQALIREWLLILEADSSEYLNNKLIFPENAGGTITCEIHDFEVGLEGHKFRIFVRFRVHGGHCGKSLNFSVENEEILHLKRKQLLAMQAECKLRTMLGTNHLFDVFFDSSAPLESITPEKIRAYWFFNDLLLKLMENFEGEFGRSKTDLHRQWNVAYWSCMLLSVIPSAVLMLRPGNEPFVVKAMNAAMLYVPVFLFFYSLAAVTMPTRFFDEYTTGLKIRRFVGAQNGKTARNYLIAILVGIPLILGFMAWTFISTFSK